MEKKGKKLLILTLLITIILSFLLYQKREGIKLRIDKIIGKETFEKNKELKSMNNVPLPLFTDIVNSKNNKKIKILIIGNSITIHGEAKDIGWNHVSGMAASKKNNDYVNLLFKKIETNFPEKSIHLRISNLSKFERDIAFFDKNSIDSLINFKPDLIIFQLGENVELKSINDELLFERKYSDLIESFKIKNNPLVICTSTFIPSLKKNNVIQKVALSTNSFLIDLSHLTLLDIENFAKNEKNYPIDKTNWKVDGIGLHPGDKGMENIAQQIFITANSLIKLKLEN